MFEVVRWIAELVRRSYSQIVLLDRQILRLIKRGVGRGSYFGERSTSDKNSGTPAIESLPIAHGIESQNAKSILLTVMQSLTLLVAQLPIQSSSSSSSNGATSVPNSTIIGMNVFVQKTFDLVAELLTSGHPAVAEMGHALLTGLSRSLPPACTVPQLGSMARAAAGVAISMHQQALLSEQAGCYADFSDAASFSSPPFDMLRGVGRALTLLNEPAMDAWLKDCLLPLHQLSNSKNNDIIANLEQREQCLLISSTFLWGALLLLLSSKAYTLPCFRKSCRGYDSRV